MKNINEIEKEIKQKGFTERAAEVEAQKIITEQATEALSYIINSASMANVEWKDLAELVAQVLDIFMPRKFDISPSTIAEDLLRYVFTYTSYHSDGFERWQTRNFVDAEDTKMPETEAKVLDVSDSSIEDLANKLSDIMHNPNLPKPIKGCLEDNLLSIHTDFYTPENILGNLKELRETEAQND